VDQLIQEGLLPGANPGVMLNTLTETTLPIGKAVAAQKCC